MHHEMNSDTCHMVDMEKRADVQTLSAEIFQNFENVWIVEDYLLLFWNKTL